MEKESNSDCPNLNLMTELIQERWLHRTTEILQYRHYLGNCYVNCGELQKDCKMIIWAILDKTWTNINVK